MGSWSFRISVPVSQKMQPAFWLIVSFDGKVIEVFDEHWTLYAILYERLFYAFAFVSSLLSPTNAFQEYKEGSHSDKIA